MLTPRQVVIEQLGFEPKGVAEPLLTEDSIVELLTHVALTEPQRAVFALCGLDTKRRREILVKVASSVHSWSHELDAAKAIESDYAHRYKTNAKLYDNICRGRGLHLLLRLRTRAAQLPHSSRTGAALEMSPSQYTCMARARMAAQEYVLLVRPRRVWGGAGVYSPAI